MNDFLSLLLALLAGAYVIVTVLLMISVTLAGHRIGRGPINILFNLLAMGLIWPALGAWYGFKTLANSTVDTLRGGVPRGMGRSPR
jgi:hypothetical protein